jgi:fibronectin-binding autotransporter adhesin
MTSALFPLCSERREMLTLIMFAWVVVAASSAWCAVKTWDGSSSGNWSTSANWTNNAAPVSGDDVVFPSTAARFTLTNNLPNLRLRSITFSAGSNYTIYGNAITLSNGIVAQQPAGRTNTIFFNITNSGALTAAVQTAGASLALNGILAGPGGVTKTGDGHLLFGGSSNNEYTGATTVNGGTLELNDTATATRMVPGNLIVNPGATVLLTEANQIADHAQVTVVGSGTGASGLLNFNNYNETIASLTLSNGGDVTSGFGTLTVTGNISASAVFNAFFNEAIISGNLSIGSATRIIDVSLHPNGSPECIISANVTGTGAAGLIKTGGGSLRLSGTNTYPGLTMISNGWVRAANATAFGSAASGTDLRGGHLVIENAVVVNESLTNSSALSQMHGAAGANAGWNSNLVLNANLAVMVFTNGILDLGGAISGVGGIAKTQPGTLRFSGSAANSYSGNTTVNEGTLEFAKSSIGLANISSGTLTVGDGVGGPSADVVRYFGGQLLLPVSIQINDSGLLDLNGISDAVGAINLVGGRIDTGAGTLGLFNTLTATSSTNFPALIFGNVDLNNSARSFTVTAGDYIPDLYVGARLGNGGLAKSGAGTLTLANSNFFTGALTVIAGEVRLENSFAAGTADSGVLLVGNSSLVLDGDIAVEGETLTLNNNTPDTTVLTSAFGATNSWTGNIVLQTSSRVSVQNNGLLELGGVISGPGALTKQGAGVLSFSGATANTHTNVTTVEDGTLLLAKSVVDGAIVGPLIIGDSLGLQDADAVRYGSPVHQIADNAPVTITFSGVLDFEGFNDAIGPVSGDGRIDAGVGGNPGFGADGSSSTFDGFILGTGFRKVGGGTLTLNGNNTNASVTVAEGTLFVNGWQQGTITIASNATLTGEGTVGHIINAAGGRVAPGAGVGVLTCSNVLFTGAGSEFMVELAGTSAGTQYDQLNVRGTNNLGGSTLKVSLGAGFAPREGQSFVILTNDGSDAIVGTFAGLPQGSVLTVDVLKFLVRYNGGSGNDIVLILTNVPAKAAAFEVTSGNGNRLIEANECNHLLLALTNTSGLLLSNVSASLSSTTPHVIIPPLYSRYPDIPVNGRGTNLTPFQVSTLPGFACGTAIDLVLTVTASASSFTTTLSVPTSCGAAGGFCGTCLGFVTNSITTNDLSSAKRLSRVFAAGTRCESPTDCPGEFNGAGTYRYDTHRFTNNGPAACFTVYVSNPCSNLFAAAYLGAYNASNVCANYLGDSGDSGAFLSFSFLVPAGSNFVVVVHDIPAEGPGCNYLLAVNSDECPPPLNISRLSGNRVRLAWPTFAAGYLLDTSAGLSLTNWNVVTNQPLVGGSNFLITNNILGPEQFYRLRRPE